MLVPRQRAGGRPLLVIVVAVGLGIFLARISDARASPVALRLGAGVSAGPALRTSISDARLSTYTGGVVMLDTAFILHRSVRLGVRSGIQRVKTRGMNKGLCALWVGPALEGSMDLLSGRWHAGLSIAYQRLEDDWFLPLGFMFTPPRQGLSAAVNVGATYAIAKRVGLRGEGGARAQLLGSYLGNQLTYRPTPYGMVMVEVLVGRVP